MTPEELLKPRYKVVAKYPGCKFKVGDIFTYVREVAQAYDLWRNEASGKEVYFSFEPYPHLFELLEWWQERNKEDLPKYLLYNKGSYVSKRGIVLMAEDWEKDWRTNAWWFRLEGSKIHTKFAGNYSPATVEQYNNYLNKQQVK